MDALVIIPGPARRISPGLRLIGSQPNAAKFPELNGKFRSLHVSDLFGETICRNFVGYCHRTILGRLASRGKEPP